MNQTRIAVVLALCIVTSSLPAEAATVKFCITYIGKYWDSGEATSYGEYFWTDDVATPVPKIPRGSYFEVSKGGSRIWSGNLGDTSGSPGLGCTANINVAAVNGAYSLRIYSWGHVNGNEIAVRDDDDYSYAVVRNVNVLDSDPTQEWQIYIPTGSAFWVMNVYAAAAFAMYRHNGGGSGEVYGFEVGDNADGLPGGYKILSDGQAGRKFIIIHEMGHRITKFLAPAVNWYLDYTFDNDDGPEDCLEEGYDPNEDHSMRSEEYAAPALAEGFAHFYAADVWNHHDTNNCGFVYYKPVEGVINPVVNCESQVGTPDFDNAYLESVCDYGLVNGVELDWLRAFWDVHTDGASPDPGFTDIVEWLDWASTEPGYDNDNAWEPTNDAAFALGGELWSNWDYVSWALDGTNL